MPKKISNVQREQVKQLILEGYTQEEIAEKVKVSLKIVKNSKKELAQTCPELTQIISENKYNRNIGKSEERYLKKIENEIELFEDIEEGWVFHLTKEEMKAKQSSKWWTFIVYPESAEKHWKEMLRNFQCEMAISPLHDKDFWTHDSPPITDKETGEIIEESGSRYKAGDKKKAHYHCIIKFDRCMNYKEANSIIRNITKGPYIQKCMSLKGQYEYFIHLNNPDKYQYEKEEIEKYNRFVIETTVADKMVLTDEIGKVIRERKLTDIEQVRAYYEGQYEYINVIATKCYYFEKLATANYRELFPEGRVQRIRVMKDEEV